MEDAFQALGNVMEGMTAETGVMKRTAMVSHWWNFQFRIVYLNIINIETDSRVGFMVFYDCAKQTKLLLAVVHGSPRHSNKSEVCISLVGIIRK